MLTPDYLEHIADDAVKLYSELENTIIRDIVRRLVNTKGIMTESARWQIKRLQQAGLVYDDVIKQIAQSSDSSEKLVRKLFQDSAIESLKYDDEVYKLAGLNPIPIQQSPAMLNILTKNVQSTNGTLKNLTLTTANSAKNSFLNAMDLAYMQVTSGAFDFNTAILNTVKNIVDKGLDVTYDTGHKDKIDVAVRRNIVTSIGQTTGKIQWARADEMQNDLVETSAHAGARPDHALWQGQVFSRSGKSNKYPDFVKATGYGTGKGLKGYNCRHDFYPFFEGISERAYTYKELEEINNNKVTHNNKEYTEYQATQMQRQAERTMRATKRELAAYDGIIQSNADIELRQYAQIKFDTTSIKLKQQKSQLDDFINQTNLRRDKSREQVAEFNKKISPKVVKSSKIVENKAKILYNLGSTQDNINAYIRDQTIRNNVLEDNTSKTINIHKQNRHIKGTKEYIAGKSYLTINNNKMQELLNKYVGTGRMIRDRNNNFIHKEFNIADDIIGVSINKDTKIETPTKKFYIHYSKTGVHIVPTIKGE